MIEKRELKPGSLTDSEVSIVKRLLIRGTFQKQEILGFVNDLYFRIV